MEYREYVFNDFSIVSKAKFYIIQSVTGEQFIPKETVPVQINPDRLDFKFNTKYEERTNTDGKVGTVLTGGSDEHFTVPLKFDIYDEYMAKTMNDSKDCSDLSLTNEKLTALGALCKYCGSPDIKVLFKWGDLEVYGSLTRIEGIYTCFSRWGRPLKAEVNVEIKTQAPDNVGHLVKTQMTIADTVDNVAMKAMLLADAAMR